MRTLSVALVAAGLSIAAAALAQPAKTLEGTWTAISAQRDGKPADELAGHRLTFAGNTFVIEKDGKLLYKGTFTTRPGATPAGIDFVNTAGEAKGKTWKGIYRFEGDTLKIVDNAPDPVRARPRQFTTLPDSGQVMLVFKRAP